jgi:two-component system response regulator FixJ
VSAGQQLRGAFTPLTRRERQVLQLVAEGKTSREIGELLGVTLKTISMHRLNAFAKLGIHKAAQVAKALERG